MGRGSRHPPPRLIAGGGRRRIEADWGVRRQALSGVCLESGAEASASRGGGEEIGAGEMGLLSLITVGSPETLLSPMFIWP